MQTDLTRATATPGRLLIVITSLQIGGAETQVVKLAQALQTRGWKVAVATLFGTEGYTKTLTEAGIPVYSLGMKRGIPDPRAMLCLARIVREWKPGVVHSHMVHANLLARLTRILVRMPVLVCTAHNTREVSERGGPTWYKEWLYGLTDRLTDRTTTICQAGYVHYVKSHAAPPGRLEVLPNGVECDKFHPDPVVRSATRKALGLREETFAWLAAGRLVAQKDYPNLLHALQPLRGGNWKLFIAGAGPLERQLKDLARNLSLTEQVEFLGIRRDLPALYNAADAFVLSSALEGLPSVLLEAASTGLACVVTDAGGSREAIKNDVTGFVVPPHNSEALARAMANLMDLPPERRRELSSAARAFCLAEFDLASVVSRWETLYASCSQAKEKPHGSLPRKKILVTITGAKLGGAQIHVQDLLANLPGGYDLVLATGEPGYLCEAAEKLRIPVRLIPNLRRAISPIHDLRATLELVQIIRTERPALIHAHTSKAGLISRLAGCLAGVPVVFTAHTWSFAEGASRVQKTIATLMEQIAARLSAGSIITVSRANEHAALEKAIANPAKLITIWNGIPDVPLRANPGTRQIPVLVMVARFAPQKNQRLLLEALAQIQHPWQLQLIGDGPTQAEIKDLAKSLGIMRKVQFLGDRNDIAALLSSADCFVLSSNWEGLPLSILEAMRAGLPVISTDIGGCSEAVIDGVTGYLIPPGDVTALRERLKRILSSTPLVQAMGIAGRARYEEHFRVERMIQRTLQVYEAAVPELTLSADLLALQSRLEQSSEASRRGRNSVHDVTIVEEVPIER